MEKVPKEEVWPKIVEELGIDLVQPVNMIMAEKITEITGQQPRLMANIYSYQDLPDIFRQNDVFILPVTRGRYAIIHGKGYHTLEPPPPSIRFRANYPNSYLVRTLKSGGETPAIRHAYISGLISHFADVPRYPDLAPDMMGGKQGTGTMDIYVGDQKLEVDRAQMEIDEALISSRDVLLIEAKSNIKKDFLIRQLYYPYRYYLESEGRKRRVRPIFLQADESRNHFIFHEYRWKDPFVLDSIELVRCSSFTLEEPPMLDVESDAQLSSIIPQANDIAKIAEYPLMVHKGVKSAEKWGESYKHRRRQGDYYKDVGVALGLLEALDGHFELTYEGHRYVHLNEQERQDYLAQALMKIPIMGIVYEAVKKTPDGIGINEIASMIKELSIKNGNPLSEITCKRRASSVMAYFKWIEKTTRAVGVDYIKRIPRIYARVGPFDKFVNP